MKTTPKTTTSSASERYRHLVPVELPERKPMTDDLTKTRPGRNPFDALQGETEKILSSKRPNAKQSAELICKLERAAKKSRVPARRAQYNKLRNQIFTQVFGVKP